MAKTIQKESKIVYLQIGQNYEHLAETKQFDVSEWVSEFPDATIYMLFKRPGEEAVAPVQTTLEDGILTWTISNWETGVLGVGFAEIRAIDSSTGMVKKSHVIPCSIEASVTDEDAAPDYPSWVDRMLRYGENVESIYEGLTDAITEGKADIEQVASDTLSETTDALDDKAAEVLAEIPPTYTEVLEGIAKQYDSTKYYQKYEFVWHDGKIYLRLNNSSSPVGAWNPDDWSSPTDFATSMFELRYDMDWEKKLWDAMKAALYKDYVGYYDSQSSYNAGDVVWKDNANTAPIGFYRAKVDITPSSTYFVPANWDRLLGFDEQITSLKSLLNVLDDGNLPIPIIKDSYIKQDGTIAAYPGWDRTDFISCNPGEKFYVTNTTRTVYCFWYASKDVSTKVQQLVVEVGESIITAPAGAYYFIISNTAVAMESMTIRGLALYSELMSTKASIEASFDLLKKTTPEKNIINRFDKTKITSGKYIDIRNGTLSSGNSFFASDFIYVGDLSSVTVSYTHLFCWYDSDRNWLDENEDNMNSWSQDLTFTRPADAAYIRFSAYNEALDLAQVGGGVSRDNYVPYGIYKLSELRVSNSQIDKSDDSRIIVDISGGGDYTSFTEAIYETVDSGIDVYVKPGTYDIVAEYVALFGQSAVDSMADADSAIFNGFQYGVRLRNRKVEFAPGSHLVCDWTGHTVNGTHRFSALGVDYDVEIIGLDLDVTATFYCIHDDYGIATPYTVKYENCRVVGHNITNANCIGGGCKKYSRHIINNCYFDNNLTGSATVRYHNTNAEGAEPEIYVSNCYFNNWFTPRWYGPQTSKMRVYVNNCHARAIYKMAESSSYDVDNVELYKWNNEETDPRN